jgi:ATPase subunit of ABC transporter with duplicated ATPase domains
VSQAREGLVPYVDRTLYEAIAQGEEEVRLGDGRMVSTRAFCSAFNLKGATQQKIVGQLSGGERNRCFMAQVLKNGHNVLLLDEPTNDLDVETLRSLEEGLATFAADGGAILMVRHDRWCLLDGLALSHASTYPRSCTRFHSRHFSTYLLSVLSTDQVSHDRWFLDRVCTHTVCFEGEGRVTFFDGSFSEFEAWRAKERAAKGGGGGAKRAVQLL